MGFDLDEIPWINFKITVEPNWIGETIRYFKTQENESVYKTCLCYAGIGRTTFPPGFSLCKTTTKREYPVYQNESVKKTSN